MSEDRNRGSRDFSQYDSMTTEDLEEILRLDAEAPMEQESDTELILYIMEVLANRRNTNNTGKTAQESWESFQQHYLPAEEELLEHAPEAEKMDNSARPWQRWLIAVAAAIVVVLCIPITAKAFGWEDLWYVVARWAKETFSFVSSDNTEASEPVIDDGLEYTSLQDLLKRNNRSYDMVPTWVPDGFILESIIKDVTPEQEIYIAHYLNDEKELRIRVQTYISTEFQKIEVKAGSTEVTISSGIKYYFFQNEEKLQVIWIYDSYECTISGDLSTDEAKKMIESIGKG